MESLSSSNTCQWARFLYCTHAAEERPKLWSSHLCGSPSAPGFHTLLQLCKSMTIWNQTISYTLLEYLQELCLGRLDLNRRCHFFFLLLWFLMLDKLNWLHASGWRVFHSLGVLGRPCKKLQSGFYLYQSDILSYLQDPSKSARGKGVVQL